MNVHALISRKNKPRVISFIFFGLISCLLIGGCKKSETTPPQPDPVPGPAISHFAPAWAGIGYPLVISGTGFSKDISADNVTINGMAAVVSAASDTQLVVTIPSAATTGKIAVTVGGQAGTSTLDIQIKKLIVTTLAGSGTPGYADGTGSAAGFSGTWGIAIDANGYLYLGDTYNSRLRLLSPAGVDTTISGTNFQGNIDGPVASATFALPFGVALDTHGNLFVTNMGFNNIRKISVAGIVSTFAGDPNGSSGSSEGIGTAARFHTPLGIVIDANDNLFVMDADNNKIRKSTPAGVVTTFAGNGQVGATDGIATAASFNQAFGIGIDAGSNLYVVEAGNNKIRKVTPNGDVTTFAGSGAKGSADGPAASASFNAPIGIVADHSGNFYITDESNALIRMISPDGYVSTVAGNGTLATVDGVGHSAGFNYPVGITIDAAGALYVVDNGSGTVRKIVIQ